MLGLCRRSETRVERFKSVLNLINESTSLDADAAAMLRTAVVLASANKKGLWAEVFEMVDVDLLLQEEMDQLLTAYQRKVLMRERQRTDEAIASARTKAIELDRSRLIMVMQRDGDFEAIPLVEALEPGEFTKRSAHLWNEVLSGRTHGLMDELGPK